MADGDFSNLDPAWSLSQDDPLRSWADQNLDWRTGKLLQQNPQAAIDSLISRGVPPPTSDAPLGYTNSDAWANSPIEPPSGAIDATNQNDELHPIVRTKPDGTIANNVTTPPFPPGGASAPPGTNPLTPPKVSSLPNTAPTLPQTPAPKKTAEGDTDEEDTTPTEEDKKKKKKKDDVGDALSGFGKSLAGVKAPTPPPLNAVGTPAAPHPTAITPVLQNLMSLLQGGAPPPSVAPNKLANLLGRIT